LFKVAKYHCRVPVAPATTEGETELACNGPQEAANESVILTKKQRAKGVRQRRAARNLRMDRKVPKHGANQSNVSHFQLPDSIFSRQIQWLWAYGSAQDSTDGKIRRSPRPL